MNSRILLDPKTKIHSLFWTILFIDWCRVAVQHLSYRNIIMWLYLKVILCSWASLVTQIVKNLPAMWETRDLIPRSRRTPLEWNGYLLQYSCLDNPWNRVLWYIIFHRARKEWDTIAWLTLSLSIYSYYKILVYIPHVVQQILIAYPIPNNLYLPLTHQCSVPPFLAFSTGNHYFALCFCESAFFVV